MSELHPNPDHNFNLKNKAKEIEHKLNRITAAADITVSNCLKKVIKDPKKVKRIKGAVETSIMSGVAFVATLTGQHLLGVDIMGSEIEKTDVKRLSLDLGSTEMPFSREKLELSLKLKNAKYAQYPNCNFNITWDEKTDFPLKYFSSEDKKDVILDQEKLKKLREKAISSKETQIIAGIVVNGNGAFIGSGMAGDRDYLREHPYVLELPKDVLSEAELSKKGVTIIQPEGTQLYIRKGAFGDGGPLENLSKAGRKLNIILVNGGVLDDKYLKDPQYKDIVESFSERNRSVGNYRNALVWNEVKNMQKWQNELKKLSKKGFSSQDIENLILESKIKIYNYSKLYSDEQIRREDNNFNKAGEYCLHGKTPLAIVYLGSQKSFHTEYLCFNKDGNIVLMQRNPAEGSVSIAYNQNYPNPKDYPMNENASHDDPDSYPYSGVSPGFILRHEIKHEELIEGAKKIIKRAGLPWRMEEKIGREIGNGYLPNSNEYDTDMATAKDIQSAWDRWVASGYKDDSGYCFVFRTPIQWGGVGYILTYDPNFKSSQPTPRS